MDITWVLQPNTYAVGTKEMMKWLDQNPLIDFRSIDRVFHPLEISRNSNFVCVLPNAKADFFGRIVLSDERSKGL